MEYNYEYSPQLANPGPIQTQCYHENAATGSLDLDFFITPSTTEHKEWLTL